MKKIAISSMIIFLISNQALSSVGDVGIGGFLGFGFGPEYGKETGIGFLVGVGYQFAEDLIKGSGDGIEARFETGFLTWSWDEWIYSFSSTDIPFLFTARYFYPVIPELRLYGALGLGFQYWSYEYYGVHKGYWAKWKDSELELGLVLGIGAEYLINPNIGFGLDIRVVEPGGFESILFTFTYHILKPELPKKGERPTGKR